MVAPTYPVERGGSSAQLVEYYERPGRSHLEDVARLLHLHHEGRATPRELIGRYEYTA